LYYFIFQSKSLRVFNMPINHYENFPVASILLPKHLRPAVAAIYTFARTADDIADEGIVSPKTRLVALKHFELELLKIENKDEISSSLFKTLQKTIEKHNLPLTPFYDLLKAFKQDVIIFRYPRFQDLLDYCKYSANPVGLLMLHLYGAVTQKNESDSNAICSALQLINFWQDIYIDWKKKRIYLPIEDMTHFNVDNSYLEHPRVDDNWRALLQFEVNRARNLMLQGAPLAKRLPGRIGWELRMVVQGGLRILELIEKADYDIFNKRPKLNKLDWLVIAWRTLWQ